LLFLAPQDGHGIKSSAPKEKSIDVRLNTREARKNQAHSVTLGWRVRAEISCFV